MPVDRVGRAKVRDRRITVSFAGLAFGLLMFMTLNWVLMFSEATGIVPGSNLGHQSGYVVAFALASAAVVSRGTSWREALPPISVLIALAWCWLSIGWALDPAAALRKLSLTSLIIFTVFIVCSALPYDRILRILRWQLVFTLGLSYLIVFVAPDIGVQLRPELFDASGVGGWRGGQLDKNACGAFCAVTVLVFLFGDPRLRPVVRWAAIAAALVFLVRSQSKTSMGILAAVTPLGLILTRYNPAYRALVIPLAMAAIAVTALLWPMLMTPFQSALYDQTAFTGRGPIWATLVGYIRDHPLLGAGYGSFWGIGFRSPAYQYTDVAWVQKVFVGHNGYLDTLSQIGVPGLILVLLAMFVMPFARLFMSVKLRPDQIALIGTLLLFAAGNNLTESTLFDRDTLLNVMMLLSIGLIGAASRGNGARLGGRRRDAGPTRLGATPGSSGAEDDRIGATSIVATNRMVAR